MQRIFISDPKLQIYITIFIRDSFILRIQAFFYFSVI